MFDLRKYAYVTFKTVGFFAWERLTRNERGKVQAEHILCWHCTACRMRHATLAALFVLPFVFGDDRRRWQLDFNIAWDDGVHHLEGRPW